MENKYIEDKYSIKGLIENIGHDLAGYKCNLYRDNIKIAIVNDDGWGGGVELHFVNKNYEIKFNNELKQIKNNEIKNGNKSKYMYSFDETKEPKFLFSIEIFLDEIIKKTQMNKTFKRKCKSNILYQIDEIIGTIQYYQIKGLYKREKIIIFIEKTYPNQNYKILNDEFTKGFK